MKVKIFSDEVDMSELEKKINKWLIENKDIEISEIKQNFQYDDNKSFYIIISIWYEMNKGKYFVC